MTDQRPAWADALTNAFVALKNQQPTPPLAPILAALAGTAVGDDELVDFVLHADENEPALTQARIALAKWDSQDEYLGPDDATTPAHTQERRAAIYARLGLSPEVAQAFTERIEVFEKPSTTISKVFEPWYAAETEASDQCLLGRLRGIPPRRQEVAGIVHLVAGRNDDRGHRTAQPSDATGGQADQGPGRRLRPEREDGELHRRRRQGNRRRLSADHRSHRHDRDPSRPDPAPHGHGAHGGREHPRRPGSHGPGRGQGTRLPAGRQVEPTASSSTATRSISRASSRSLA